MVTISHVLGNSMTIRVMCLECRAFTEVDTATLEALPDTFTTEGSMPL
tara:strand:+ start:3747 stop:3890 length:144 start_codon:yes stop_codon:yes gene_type:complete